MRLKNKVSIVTGSSANIGRAIAILFAREGSAVVVNSCNNVEGGRAVVREIEALGGRAAFFHGDVSNVEVAHALVDECLKRFGRLDILVNNAGRATPGPFFESTPAHWQELFDSNFYSAVFTSQAAAKVMLKQKAGKIIHTASIRGLEHVGRRHMMAYGAAKAALINFTKTLAAELAPNIQVNAIAPGFTYTSKFEEVPEEKKKEWIEGTLIKRWITPEELAESFLWLATSDVVTGEVLVVDGGYNLKEISA